MPILKHRASPRRHSNSEALSEGHHIIDGGESCDLLEAFLLRPSMGKSALALWIADAISKTAPSVLFSLEMSSDEILTRWVCGSARVDLHRLRGGYLNPDERHRLDLARRRMPKRRLQIEDSAVTTVSEISAKCRRIKSEQGLGLIVIDYLQLMRDKGRSENRTQEISAISRGLKILAKDLSVPIIALSQLSRACETRPGDHRPILSDLRESGSIEQDADVVGFIYREEVYKPDWEDLQGLAELHVAKQRNGPTGRIPLTFLSKYARFENRVESDSEVAA